MNTDSTPNQVGTTNRRTFIMASSAVVAGAALFRGDLTAGNGGLASFAAANGPRVGVGYIEGSAGLASLGDVFAAGGGRIVPASDLRSGGLSNEAAMVTVHGFTPGVSPDASCPYANVLVDAHVASPDRYTKGATVPFYAWTFRRSPAPMASGRSRFVIAASRGMRVGFSVSTGTPATTVFTSGSERNLPKLQRGMYVLGLNSGAWRSVRSLPTIDDPAWSDLASIVVSIDTV